MRISEAARRLGTSARMLRYREDLGLLPQVRDPLPWPSGPGAAPRGAGAARGADAAGGLSAARGLSAVGGLSAAVAHRQFSEADLEAVAAALELERRYDISPASLAFGLRVLAEPPVRAAVADLGRRLGRIPATPGQRPGLREGARPAPAVPRLSIGPCGPDPHRGGGTEVWRL